MPDAGIRTLLGAIFFPLLIHMWYELWQVLLTKLSILRKLKTNLSTKFSRFSAKLSPDWSGSSEVSARPFWTLSSMCTEPAPYLQQWKMPVILATTGFGITAMWSTELSHFIWSRVRPWTPDKSEFDRRRFKSRTPIITSSIIHKSMKYFNGFLIRNAPQNFELPVSHPSSFPVQAWRIFVISTGRKSPQ
jgi:hypothetical protein